MDCKDNSPDYVGVGLNTSESYQPTKQTECQECKSLKPELAGKVNSCMSLLEGFPSVNSAMGLLVCCQNRTTFVPEKADFDVAL